MLKDFPTSVHFVCKSASLQVPCVQSYSQNKMPKNKNKNTMKTNRSDHCEMVAPNYTTYTVLCTDMLIITIVYTVIKCSHFKRAY